MTRKRTKPDGRSSDLELCWLTATHGERWEEWRELAAQWLTHQDRGLGAILAALSAFFSRYMVTYKLPTTPLRFFTAKKDWPDFYAELTTTVEPIHATGYNNYVHAFLNFALTQLVGEEDDFGDRTIPPGYRNPLPRLRRAGHTYQESVRTPLPTRYLNELRHLLCPVPEGHFRDWTLAQKLSDRGSRGVKVSWFEVTPDSIDFNDPDCVWRKRQKGKNEIYEIWSPVRAVALLVKLLLPLRTYQVRMLDSGEADTFRYVHGQWAKNDNPLATGTVRRPTEKGVFRRSTDATHMFINTNKTADSNKDEAERGYVIPWQNQDVLYWLEKLRDWQEKYNPLDRPMPLAELQHKHFGSRNSKSPRELARMGATCFLFRDASSSHEADWDKPVSDGPLFYLWHKALTELERRCAERGETLPDGTPLQFVVPNSRGATTLYPLHTLRVSLITAFAEAGLELPILSKLVSGHSRLLMTIYYIKHGQAYVQEAMDRAAMASTEQEQAQFKNFLSNAEYKQLQQRSVVNDEAAWRAIKEGSPSGWQMLDRGICPMACQGCDNGGAKLSESKTLIDYAPVPKDAQGNPRNCVRCRWFLTGPAFLPGLGAHFNTL